MAGQQDFPGERHPGELHSLKHVTAVLFNTVQTDDAWAFMMFNGATWLDSRTFLANVTRASAAAQARCFAVCYQSIITQSKLIVYGQGLQV
jgi:hypothetical protein